MKINKIIGVLILFSNIFIVSCSKSFLERNPYDQIGADSAITDETSLENALTGAYAKLLSDSLFGRDLPIIGDLQADNTYITSNNTGRYLSIYQYNILNTNGTYGEIFSAAYMAILRANKVIDANVTGDNVTSIKAQAYALRGLLYFALVNSYAKPYTDPIDSGGLGVPIILHYDVSVKPARNSIGEVYKQIISDLNAAYADAPDYSSSVTISKYAAGALLARAYLFFGDYVNAQKTALDVINSKQFSLVDTANYKAFWEDPGVKTNKVEVMFEINADKNNNNGFDDFAGMYENGYGDIFACSQLIALYNSSDIRLSVIIAGKTKAGQNGYIVDKFPNASNSDRDNIKIIRLSEVYLIAAEASAALGDNTNGQKYLNALMAVRDPSLSYSSTGAQLINDITKERRKELAFEGNRFWDLNRLKLDFTRGVDAGSLPTAIGANNPILFKDYRRIGPIPEAEILANPNIADQQNPGYGK